MLASVMASNPSAPATIAAYFAGSRLARRLSLSGVKTMRPLGSSRRTIPAMRSFADTLESPISNSGSPNRPGLWPVEHRSDGAEVGGVDIFHHADYIPKLAVGIDLFPHRVFGAPQKASRGFVEQRHVLRRHRRA